MSMTDEGTRPSEQQTAKKNPESRTAPGRPDQLGASLPGLAAFGQMPGYKPVSKPASEAEPVGDVYEDAPSDYSDDSYADQFAQEFSRDFDQQQQAPEQSYESDRAECAEMGSDEDTGEAAFSIEEIQNYMAQQRTADETEQHDSAYGGGAEYASDAMHHDTRHDAVTSLKTFEPGYGQHPEIPLGIFEEPGGAHDDQPFIHEPGQNADADFLGSESAPDVAAPKERRGRKVLMATSGLIGVLALGGALAFAYKIGGESDIARIGKPPLIQADSKPVKVVPENPGGKEFPHANKKIYERLGGNKSEEVVSIKPRQEDVAAAATAAVEGGSSNTASASSDTAGPRRVKTLTVRPDGTIEAPESTQKVIKAPEATATVMAPDGTITMKFPSSTTKPEPAPTNVASAPPPVAPTIPGSAVEAPEKPAQAPASQAPAQAAPPPVQKPTAASLAAAPAASPASNGVYVVQVAARKNQTDALAAFADIQQKYPRLLDGYRPIIMRADLGSKGVWYRLNVGPVESKQVASALCGQLKGAGMKSCIVREQ